MTKNEARERAAQCWTYPTTSNKVMDTELAEVFAETLCKEIKAIKGSHRLIVAAHKQEIKRLKNQSSSSSS